MKKVLIFSYIPYPLNGGGHVAQFAVLQVLQYKMDVTFCAIMFNKDAEKNVAPLQQLLPNVKIITAFSGTNNRSKQIGTLRKTVAAARRIIGIARKSKHIGLHQQVHDDFLNPRTNSPFDFKPEYLVKEVYRISREQEYDIIQTEFHPLLELIHTFPTSSKTVFVAHESRFLRLKSCYEDSRLSAEFKDFIIKRNEVAEIGLMRKYDAVITFSDYDSIQLKASGAANVHSIPFPVIQSEFLPNKKYQQPQKIVFIGNEGHIPNKEGLLWYMQNCHELCVKKYHLPLTIIGNWLIKEDLLNKYSNINFVGSVESIDEYYEQSILIVPIFTGSGIRTKILYGMAKKVPVISTTFGCSGIEVENGKQLHLADTAESFLNSIGDILANELETAQMTEAAYDFVYAQYNQQVILDKRLELYNMVTSTN